MDTAYIFMTDESVNPANGNGNTYYVPNVGTQTLYIVQKPGSSLIKAFSSHGANPNYKVGGAMKVVADQSGRNLGVHAILGIIEADGTRRGAIPNQALKHGVVK